MPNPTPHAARTWLLGYTCEGHRMVGTDLAGTGVEVIDCKCKPNLGARILWLLGLRFLEEVSPVHPLAPVEPRWCQHTWDKRDAGYWPDGTAKEAHVCELAAGHGAPEHECNCGSRQPTDLSVDRITRMLHLPATYDDCLWPEDGVCPRHDRATAWPAGRDCLGTCTNCNSTAVEEHAPSCPHYDAAAIAAHDALIRDRTNRKA